MKDTRDKINPDASRRVSVKKAGNKEVEVKSIKIIQENADYDAAQRRKLTFDLNGKQKEEIKITISELGHSIIVHINQLSHLDLD